MVAKKKKKTVKKKSVKELKPVTSKVKKERTKAALSYLWIVGLITLLTEKKNKFIRFHAKQATALFLIETIATLSIVLALVTPIAGIAAAYGCLMALQGKMTKIPLIYELGEWFAKAIGR